MNKCSRVVLVALVAAGAFIGGLVADSLAGEEDTRSEARRAALVKLLEAKSEVIALGKAAKATPLGIRLTVTVEGQNDARKKVLDSLFNQDGELVSLESAVAEVTEAFKSDKSGDLISKCYDRCKHHLDEGHAPQYAVCFYACLAAPD